MVKVKSMLLALVLPLLASCGLSAGADNAANPGNEQVGFRTEGDKLLDANGNEFIMRGVNYSWAWQFGQSDPATIIEAAKRQGFNCIRIQIADGGVEGWKKPTAQELEEVIGLCEKNGLIAIFNTHDATGKNEIADLRRAADYWVSVADVVNRHLSTVIVNITNEWLGKHDSDVWAEGYTSVIPLMREAGIRNTIMVDAAGWGQYPKSIADKGAEVLKSDPDSNIVFSLHIYENSGATPEQVHESIGFARVPAAPVVVGEFGYRRGVNDIAYQAIMDYCQENGIGWLAWSWTGNTKPDNTLDLFAGYDDSEMLENGKLLILGKNGIRETSQPCSVFEVSAPK